MATVDINTVPGLLEAIGNHGGLQSDIEIYDTAGKRYKITAVYPSVDTICLDIRIVPDA